MKKCNRPSGQKTLFQTWSKRTKKSEKQNSKSLFETWATTNTSTASHEKRENEESLEDITTIGDDNDDELLAAVDQMEECENAKNNHDVGNLSFSACTNGDGCDVILGFDCSAGNSWIYPTNYPLRDYQFNIVQKALFHNTLVTLPTGLGKTFIAAVVMYNFYRWYPQGKIIFMAPTKPLVAQQIDACYNIMGIPRQDTAEMTGNMAPAKREQSWKEKRVFFLTPQVFQNDLSRGSCRADDVVCLVFDEAHKALGNHSYCQVVREVLGYTQNFRVLALSATPGDGIKAVQQVITNLLVSNIELRSEDSVDIKPYTHQRQVVKIVVKLGDELEFFKTKFLRVLTLVVSRLFSYQVLWMRDAARVNKCMLLAAREQFRKKCAAGQQPRYQMGPIEGDFAVALSLYHGYDLLMQHGLLPFYNFIKGIVDGSKGSSRAKTELTRNPDFVGILDDLRDQIEPDQSDSNANGSNVKPSFIGHPKLVKLKDIVLEHFRAYENTSHAGNTKGSRVMIFSQFRDSVQEISRMLSEYKPLVKVMSFIGQQSKGHMSKGLTQKEQLEVLRQFRNGGYNTLVATCVGEEGLDIGEVDLIVCFDASASPIRLVQRMGRTGRKRDGRIVVLVTEGKEEQIYQRSQRNKSNIHKTILESARTLDLYMENPRMVPKNIKPVCQKMFITVDAKSPKNKSKSAKAARKSTDGNIKKLLTACSRKGFLSSQELRYWNDNFKLPYHEAGLTPSKTTPTRPRGPQATGERYLQTEPALSLTEWTAWQTPLQQVHFVNHSKRSRHFTEILEFCDFRRDCGDSDDSYDLEMQSFLNREDIVQPGEMEAAACVLEKAGKKRNKAQDGRKGKEIVVVNGGEDDGEMTRTEDGSNNMTEKKDTCNNKTSKKDGSRKRKSTDFGLDSDDDGHDDDEDGEEKTSIARKKNGRNNINRSREGSSDMAGKGNESSRKRKSTDFGSDIDDDFEDVLMNAPEKTAKVDQDQPHYDPFLGRKPEKISPAKKQLEPSHSLAKKQSESGNFFRKNQSKCGHTLTKNQLESIRSLKKNQSESNLRVKNQSQCVTYKTEKTALCFVEDHSEFPQERNDEVLGSDNDLSDLLDIPSSQRQRKLTRGQIPKGLKPDGLVSEILPDAPSLDTLLDLSALNAGDGQEDQSDFQEGVSDHDFFPSMFTETPRSSKGKTYNNINKHFVQSSKVGLGKRKSFDEISDKECDRFGIKKGEISAKVSTSKKLENMEKQEVFEKPNKSEKSGSVDKSMFRKTCGRSVKVDGLQERLTLGNTKVRNRNIEAADEGTGGDDLGRTFSFKEKTFGKEMFELEDKIQDGGLEPRTERDHLDKEESPVFGSGLVCDAGSRNKEDDGVDFDFCQELANSFFEDGDNEIDRALCDVQTPCLFDDDDGFENMTERNTEQTSNLQGTTKHFSHGNLCSEAENIDTKKNNFQTPRLFDDDMFENMSERNHTEQNSKPQRANQHSSPKKLYSENIDTKKHNVQTPKLFDDEKFENKKSEKQTMEPPNRNKRLTPRSLYSEVDDLSTDKKDFGESIDEKLTTSTLQRKPLLEHNIDSKITNESTKLKSRVDESSLSRIRSFSFTKPDTDQSKSLKDMTSESLDEHIDIPDEYSHDVVAPSPHRVKPRTSYFGKVDKTRSFRGESFSLKSVCSEKGEGNEIKTCQNRRRMLKLKSKEMKEDFKSSEGVQVDAEMLKSSLLDGAEKKEKDTTRMDRTLEAIPSLSQNRKNNFPTKVCTKRIKGIESFSNETKSDKHLTPLNKSSVKKTSLSAKDENKVEFHQPQVAESLYTSVGSSNKTVSGAECQEDVGESVEDSPLVTKAKGKMRSKTLRNKLLESDEEYGDVSSDNDGEYGEEITKESEADFQDEASVVCTGSSNKRNFIGNQTKEVHEISDSDDQFDLPKKVKRKRKLPVHGQLKDNKPKKRRPLLDDFLDDEAEVSEDEMNDTHGLSNDEEGLEEMEDSFIDDRSQLTQRSPLTAMKHKKKDKSANMMDIYRLSLLTPHRQQLRFQTPTLHRYKNRYKMVYDKHPPARNTLPTDDDNHYDVSMETEESDEDTMVEERDAADPPSVSPEESQIVVRKNRRGKRRVLAESYFTSPEAADSEHRTKLSEHQTKLCERKTKLSEQNKSLDPTRGLCVEVKVTENISSIHSKKSGSIAADDAIFKRPGNTAPVSGNRRLNGTTEFSSGYPGGNENIDDILAVLNDCDDESLMMEINALPSLASAFEDSTLGKNGDTENTSETPLRNFSRKTPDYSSNNSYHATLSTDFSKPERTCSNTRGVNTNTNYDRNNETSSLSKKPNLSRSLQHNSNKRQVFGTRHPAGSSSFNSNMAENKQKSRNDSNDQHRNSKCNETEMPKTKNGQCAGKRSMTESNTSNVQQKSRTGLSSGQKCQSGFKTNNCNGVFRTNAKQNLNSTLTSPNNNYTWLDYSVKLNDCKTLTSNAKPNETLSASRTANKSTNVSPVFPPLSTITSSKDNTSYAHVLPEKITGQVSPSEQTKLDTSKAVTEISVNPTKASSPVLTVWSTSPLNLRKNSLELMELSCTNEAAQRDKNKLTILVGSKEVSNCQIVSFLRRKHNIKTVVSQITGCDYIVSTRMAVERKFVSDISNQANYNKLTARVRELCDLYDRPCVVIERDRVRNGETQVKCEVRSKYFDRILACLAQTHIKVLFSDGQESTSDILASLTQVEEKKNRAIIYPLPLSKDKEQIVKFLSSIPRTSYITAISLCYHNKTLQEIINSSAEELVKRVKTLSLKRANDILKFLQHGFSADMVNCGNT